MIRFGNRINSVKLKAREYLLLLVDQACLNLKYIHTRFEECLCFSFNQFLRTKCIFYLVLEENNSQTNYYKTLFIWGLQLL